MLWVVLLLLQTRQGLFGLFPVRTAELKGALVWLPLDIHIRREMEYVVSFSLKGHQQEQ